jgi:integrase
MFYPVLTEKGWRISIPATMTASGKRERKFFESEREANKAASSIRNEYHRGSRGGVISQGLALQAAEAAEILEPYGLTLVEAAKMVAAQHDAKGTDETFQERYDRFVRTQEAHWRSRYATDMGKIPQWVGKAFMARRVALITPGIIESALRSHGAKADSTVKARAARVKSVLAARGNKRRGKNIKIMTEDQCRHMLNACKSPEETWAVALLLFAGIRPSVEDGEITRLDWEAVGETEIYISPDVSKTGTDRHIPITPRLRELLKGRPKEGTVIPARWRLIYQRLRKAAGVSGEQDITRHTFASHFLAAYGENAAKSAMGHTKDSDTLFRHYRRAVTEREGKGFFGS